VVRFSRLTFGFSPVRGGVLVGKNALSPLCVGGWCGCTVT
jgi:hypothetical protein